MIRPKERLVIGTQGDSATNGARPILPMEIMLPIHIYRITLEIKVGITIIP